MIGVLDKMEGTSREMRDLRCCHLDSLSQLLKALERCPNLASLSLLSCLPQRLTLTASPLFIRLDQLEEIYVADQATHVQTFLECVGLPDTASLAISTESAYDALSEFLPVINPLSCIPTLRMASLILESESAPSPFPYTVRGCVESEEIDLDWDSVLTVESCAPPVQSRHLDLSQLFQGFARIFSPALVTALFVNLHDQDISLRPGQSDAWLWLLHYFPNVRVLQLEAVSFTEFFAVLAQEDVVPELERLYVTLTGTTTDWAAEHEAALAALPQRAARATPGPRLLFMYRRRMLGGDLAEVPLVRSYVDRFAKAMAAENLPTHRGFSMLYKPELDTKMLDC